MAQDAGVEGVNFDTKYVWAASHGNRNSFVGDNTKHPVNSNFPRLNQSMMQIRRGKAGWRRYPYYPGETRCVTRTEVTAQKEQNT